MPVEVMNGEYVMRKKLFSVMFVAVFVLSSAAVAQDGIRAGDFILSPYADLSVISDSNVRTDADDEEDDISLIVRVGLSFQNTVDQIRLRGNVWGLAERYYDLDEEDHEDWGQSLSLRMFDRDRLQITLRQSFARVESFDYAVGSTQERDDLRAGIALGRNLTDKLEGDLDYAFRKTDYESPNVFDWDQHRVMATLGHVLTDKTSATLSLSAGRQSSDGNDDDADFYAARIGLRTRGTDKMTGAFGVGFQRHESDQNINIPSFRGSVNWRANENMTVFARAENTVEPATQDINNYNKVIRASLGTSVNVMQDYLLSFTGRYNRNDIDRRIDDGAVSKDDDTYTVSARLTYRPPARWLQAFLDVQYEDKTATPKSNEYSQTMVKAGVNLRY